MSLINFIQKYRKSKRILFTTPSHSQGKVIAPDSLKLLGKKFFECDYSEVDGFDNLLNPEGIIKDIQVRFSEFYDTKASFLLTNGASSGIVASMMALLKENDKVLIARNCHKSVYNGLVLTKAQPIWIMPQYNEDWGIYESVNLYNLEEIFNKNKGIKVFILTNPTYEGYMCDIHRISEICKKYGVYLIVDEAHGALLSFNRSIGTPALIQGADIVVQSLHKTAGALNPSALLHINKDSNICHNNIQDSLNLITTTSPSYPLLLNIEATFNYLTSTKGQDEIHRLIKDINRLIRKLNKIPNLQIYSDYNDVTKILVKVSNVSGFELSDILSKKYNIEDECANEKSILFLTGIGTTKDKLKKLQKALAEVALDNITIVNDTDKLLPLSLVEPRIKYKPSEVWGKPYKEIEPEYSLSLVAMEVVCDYPPGIPIVMPGEVIKKEHVEYLKNRPSIRVLAN